MSADAVRQIADAVLYEGYVLWPYRRSALKNQQRFTFGGVYPEGWPEGPARMVSECLVECEDEPDVEVRVRFLHVVERRLHDAAGEPVDELAVGGERHLGWEESTEREVAVRAPGGAAVDVPAGEHAEPLTGPEGEAAGTVTRSWAPLRGRVEVGREPVAEGLWRLRVEVVNEARFAASDGPAADRAGGTLAATTRADVLRRTFCSTHAVLTAARGELVSLTDPPAELVEHAAACENEGAWPVLVGKPGERTTVLASPIILEDYPRVAPESPGDLFDGGEVDQLLTLNILALTDAEKAEMRDSDPRAREILERTEALTEEELTRLHGTFREPRPAG